jgi:hypothetical protein
MMLRIDEGAFLRCKDTDFFDFTVLTNGFSAPTEPLLGATQQPVGREK